MFDSSASAAVATHKKGRVPRALREEQLLDNFSSLMESVVKAKPAAAKGVYLKSIYLCGTMGPSTRVDAAAAGRLSAR